MIALKLAPVHTYSSILFLSDTCNRSEATVGSSWRYSCVSQMAPYSLRSALILTRAIWAQCGKKGAFGTKPWQGSYSTMKMDGSHLPGLCLCIILLHSPCLIAHRKCIMLNSQLLPLACGLFKHKHFLSAITRCFYLLAQ
jgi:hypothetical protein